jgi:queuine/archaeosine tRNA-ribosyltransferase
MRFYQRLMTDVRSAISSGSFEEFRRTDPRCRLGPREDSSEDSVSDGNE